ncbi:MAG TPA: hypothetical protein VI072_12685 [Polyangiaceae bacterium]
MQKKRSNRKTKRSLGTLSLITAAVAAVAPMAEAEPTPPQRSAAPKPPVRPKFKDTNVIGIKELSAEPALPRAGEPVTLTFAVVNDSDSEVKNVEWKISGALAKSGVIASIRPKDTRTVKLKLKAPRGAFQIVAELDPLGKIAEPQSLRRNNTVTLKSVAVATSTAWDGWVSKAAAQIGMMIELAKAKTSVVGTINGATLTVSNLKVDSLDTSAMQQLLKANGVPDDVAAAFALTFAETLKEFADKYRAAVPFAYPALAAWPGPVAPPMPNVPFVLAIGSSGGSALAFAPTTIENVLLARLSPARKQEAGAKEAILRYAAVLSGRLYAWIGYQQVSSVLGSGAVPTFAPPYVPVGPVVMGTTAPAPRHLF